MGDDLQLRLRPFTEADLDFLDRLDTDPDALGPFEWFGFRDPRTRRRRWEKDGFLGAESSALAIELAGGEVAGVASWKDVRRGGSPGTCLEIGAAAGRPMPTRALTPGRGFSSSWARGASRKERSDVPPPEEHRHA